jgi:hypothetical protein
MRFLNACSQHLLTAEKRHVVAIVLFEIESSIGLNACLNQQATQRFNLIFQMRSQCIGRSLFHGNSRHTHAIQSTDDFWIGH